MCVCVLTSESGILRYHQVDRDVLQWLILLPPCHLADKQPQNCDKLTLGLTGEHKISSTLCSTLYGVYISLQNKIDNHSAFCSYHLVFFATN